MAGGANPKSADAARPKVPLIVLDAGHGGEDNGAHGRAGLLEKNAALAIAKATRSELEKLGFRVSLTRSDDTFIPLWDRAKIANDKGADLFLSLHLNAARARAATGSEVYFLSLGQAEADAQATADAENGPPEQAAAPGPDVVASILDDLAQKAFLRDSQSLAVDIQRELNRLAGIKQRGVKQAPFIVLRSAAMPAVLVESAFVSNAKEEKKLKDPAFVAKLGEAIAKGVKAYLANQGGGIRRRAEDGGHPAPIVRESR
ncbi:MAG TPA: N-acetylmuramoyl-L-alanine amidase [Holophagaceae bacterium]|jgi:N-acetylmuramoyl-L-alanine amidase|nr:N-acetylmuramoyl-L-alanine amidase [Holophagaceae bacterium]